MADLEGKLREFTERHEREAYLWNRALLDHEACIEQLRTDRDEARALGRAEGLEEAAKVADSFSGKPTSGFTQGKWWEVTDRIAEAIRALKEKV